MGLAGRVVAVGEDQYDAAPFDGFQLVESEQQGVEEARAVAVVEVADLGDQLIAVAGELAADLDPIVEGADGSDR